MGWNPSGSTTLRSCSSTGKSSGFLNLRPRFESGREHHFGRLAEWLIASVLKTDTSKGDVGSNPTPSAIFFGELGEWLKPARC
jgi:hypothetical protein